MEVKQNKELAYSESIVAAYQLWQTGQSEKMVRLAINARLVVFREQPHLLISSTKGRSA
jgi:hypothetical protein